MKRSAVNKDESFNLSGAENPREESLGPTPSTGSEPPPPPPPTVLSQILSNCPGRHMRVKPETPAWRVIKNSLVVLSPKKCGFYVGEYIFV